MSIRLNIWRKNSHLIAVEPLAQAGVTVQAVGVMDQAAVAAVVVAAAVIKR